MSQAAVQHLKQVLALNPLFEAETILERRHRFLGITVRRAVARVADSEQSSEQRELARRMIDDVRNKFWGMPLETLRAHLDAVDFRPFPELKAAADRLRMVATFRPDFPRLAQHPKTHLSLFGFFKNAVVLPPREAGAYKERCLQNLAASDALKVCQNMVRMMRKEFPDLYQLESDWLSQIGKLKRAKGGDVYVPSSGESFGFSVPGWLIWVIVVLVLRIIMAAMR
jgi:hypothetical protein